MINSVILKKYNSKSYKLKGFLAYWLWIWIALIGWTCSIQYLTTEMLQICFWLIFFKYLYVNKIFRGWAQSPKRKIHQHFIHALHISLPEVTLYNSISTLLYVTCHMTAGVQFSLVVSKVLNFGAFKILDFQIINTQLLVYSEILRFLYF